MIRSILDTDLYKFSTSNAYFQLYPLAEGTFKFNDRAKESWKDTNFIENIQRALINLSNLRLSNAEKDWCIARIPYIPANYWEWLTTFKFEPKKIHCWLDEDGVFQCEVTDKLYKAGYSSDFMFDSADNVHIISTWSKFIMSKFSRL